MSPEGFVFRKLPKILRGLGLEEEHEDDSADDFTPSFNKSKTKATGRSKVLEGDERSRVYLP